MDAEAAETGPKGGGEEGSKPEPRRFSDWIWPRGVLIGFLVLVFLMIVMGGAAVWFSNGLLKGKADPGQFGDMFGAANALFSGLALLGVVVAIILQQEELGMQRREMEETAGAMLHQV